MTTTIPGAPEDVLRGARDLQRLAAELDDLSADLLGLADEHRAIGAGPDAARVRTREAAASLSGAAPRYAAAGAALRWFGEELEAAQRAARLAAADRDAALAAGDSAGLELAAARLARAVEDWDAAGATAAARIRSELESSGDTFGERWDAFWGEVGVVVLTTAEAVGGALDGLVAIALLVVTALDGAVVLLMVFGAIAADPVASGLLVADLAEDPAAALERVLGATLVLLPALSPGLALVLARERATPTPRPVERGPATLRRSSTTEPYAAAFETVAALDTAGGEGSAVVEIVQVLDEDGSQRTDDAGHPVWRVTLPSTTDWQLGGGLGDAGAPNDLGSNIALLLGADGTAPFERAVVAAMREAGIGPDDPVALIGFSQGGILAARLASADPPPFDIRAILVAGAAIDRFPIPDDVSVVALEHDGDIVPRLDGVLARNAPGHVVIAAAPAGRPHAALSYAATAARLLDGATDPRVRAELDRQAMFHSGQELVRRFEFAEADHALA